MCLIGVRKSVMSKRVFGIGALLALYVVLGSSCGPTTAERGHEAGITASVGAASVAGGRFVTAQRIVSFAPSLTEMLFALGLGERVVGVSEYCVYPPEVKALPKVGGFLNPNVSAAGQPQEFPASWAGLMI